MKEQEFNYVLDRIKNVEVPNNEEVQSENIIDGLVESVEYTPIQVEGVIFEIESNDGNYVFQFDYDEINPKNNMKILKKPPIEEVKEHFKNAQIVECLFSKKQYNVKNGEINFIVNCYWIDLNVIILKVWSDSLGYAKIIK